MKTETSAHATERAKRATRPVYFLRFYHVPTQASGLDYPFSVDFSSGTVPGSTKTKYPWMLTPEGNTQTIEAELGRSTIGGFKLGLVDVADEITRYMANGLPNASLTLNGALSAGATTVPTNENTVNYPAIGTIEIPTAGVIERIRYTGKTANSFTGCTRGVDGTSAVTHNNTDPVGNGEQIRPGQRVQLFCGYQDLPAESDFLSFVKMQVVQRDEVSPKTWVIECEDILRTLRRNVFLNASTAAPTSLCGNPIDCLLAILLSDGNVTALSGTLTKTAGSAAIVGSGTNWNVSLAVGDIVRAADGELLRVASGITATTFTAAQTAILTASVGITHRKGGTNGKYAVLDAVDGMQIPSAFVDITTHESLRTSDFATDQYQFSLDTTEDGKSFLELNFFKSMNCYPKVNQTGQLSIVRYKIAVGAPTVTLDNDVIINATLSQADRQIINQIQIAYDWNLSGFAGVFGTRQTYEKTSGDLNNPMSIEKYSRRQALIIESKGIRTTLGGAAIANSRALEVTRRYAEPQAIAFVDCLYSKHTLEPGDQINFTNPYLPNLRTGGRGFTAEVFEILDMQPSFGPNGRIRFTLFWVAAQAAQTAPTSGGVVTTNPPYPAADTTPPAVPTGLGGTPTVFIDSDGNKVSAVDVAWAANGESDLQGYEVNFKRTADSVWTARTVNKPATGLREIGLAGGVSYDLRIKAFDTSGNFSAFSSTATFTSSSDTTAPSAPTGMSALAIPGKEILVSWTAVSAVDLAGYNVYRHTANVAGSATLIASVGIPQGAAPKPSYIDGDPTLDYGRTYFYWATAVDRTGNESAKAASAGSITVAAITITDMDRDAGAELGQFSWYHSAPFGAGSPRDTWREASMEFAYVQASGDRLEYDVLFEGSADATLTIGGVDIAAIERGPENAASATSTTLVLNAGASGSDSFYNNMWIEILSNGTPAANGQTRKVTAYVGATKTATVAAWGTTPTGTISYRVIRLLSIDGGNDQNALSSKPDTTLGQRALNQWYHRVISLPSAWNGKTILGAATAMHTAQASLTQTMLVKNAIITTTATGNPIAVTIGRYAFTEQPVWKYGTETNAGTVVVRLESIGGSAPTQVLTALAAGRAAYSQGVGGSTTSTTETVVATLTNFTYAKTKEDVIPVWWQLTLLVQCAIGLGNNTGTFRIRGDSVSGPILGELTMTAVDGAVGKGGLGNNRADALWSSFALYVPTALGPQTLVLTCKASNVNGAGETVQQTGKLMGWAKSA